MAKRQGYKRASLAVAILGVLVALAAWLFPNLTVDSVRQPLSSPGGNPWMPPVGTDRPGVSAPPNTQGNFPGSTPGLYGGTRNHAACDPGQMVAFLRQHADKAAAWAAVLGIRPEAIAGYVATLTPVILRGDTAVTNHGFAHGHATTIPAILQAGTAVLVDNRGVPVTKCFCGNPLTPPALRLRRTYSGPVWAGFSPKRITSVRAASVTVTVFTLVDPATNTAFDRPAGSTGAQDRDSKAPTGPPAGNVSVALDGSWHTTDAVMLVASSGGQTTLRWILTTDHIPGHAVMAGPQGEVCVTATAGVRTGTVALSCRREDDPTNNSGPDNVFTLDVVDAGHVVIGAPPMAYPGLSGPYTRCASADACKTR